MWTTYLIEQSTGLGVVLPGKHVVWGPKYTLSQNNTRAKHSLARASLSTLTLGTELCPTICKDQESSFVWNISRQIYMSQGTYVWKLLSEERALANLMCLSSRPSARMTPVFAWHFTLTCPNQLREMKVASQGSHLANLVEAQNSGLANHMSWKPHNSHLLNLAQNLQVTSVRSADHRNFG